MLARTAVSTDIPVPHEPGQWLRFRRLTARQLETARAARRRHAIAARAEAQAAELRALGADGLALKQRRDRAEAEAQMEAIAALQRTPESRALLEAAVAARTAPQPAAGAPDAAGMAEAAEAAVVGAYDGPTLLGLAVDGWSYAGVPAEELAREDGGLDPETERWAVLEALRYNELLPGVREARLGN